MLSTTMQMCHHHHHRMQQWTIDPPITRTWCSPLTRCRQTYAAINGCCSSYTNNNNSCSNLLPDPTIHDDLREIHLCEWQGRLRQEIIKEDPGNWNVFKKDPKQLKLGSDKSFAPVLDCWERGMKNWNVMRSDAANGGGLSSITKAREELEESKQEGSGAIFIMTHGAIGQCMLLQALGLSIEMYGKSRKYSFDNCECIEIEWADGDEHSTRWRRVHPVATKWECTSASQQMASGGLSCSR